MSLRIGLELLEFFWVNLGLTIWSLSGFAKEGAKYVKKYPIQNGSTSQFSEIDNEWQYRSDRVYNLT